MRQLVDTASGDNNVVLFYLQLNETVLKLQKSPDNLSKIINSSWFGACISNWITLGANSLSFLSPIFSTFLICKFKKDIIVSGH